MNNNDLIEQHLKYKFLYSMAGLILGLVSILCGSYLLINGAIGTTQFSASIFGNEAKLTDAAPGTILFVVGLFLVVVSRYSKIKLPTSEGGNFVGAPIPPEDNFDMHNFPTSSRAKIANLFKNVYSFESDDISFLRKYLKYQTCGVGTFQFSPPGGYYIEKGKGVDDDLWSIYSKSKSFDEFLFLCIEYCYEHDKSTNVLQICSYIYDSIDLIKNKSKIVEILKNGVWNQENSNELRWVSLWLLRCLNIELMQRFYKEELSRFLIENDANEKLCVSFIESIVTANLSSNELENVIDFVSHYLEIHPEIKNTMKSGTKKKLKIA